VELNPINQTRIF